MVGVCIKSFRHLKNFGKTLLKVHFCITIMVHKSIKELLVLKTPVPEQRLASS